MGENRIDCDMKSEIWPIRLDELPSEFLQSVFSGKLPSEHLSEREVAATSWYPFKRIAQEVQEKERVGEEEVSSDWMVPQSLD